MRALYSISMAETQFGSLEAYWKEWGLVGLWAKRSFFLKIPVFTRVIIGCELSGVEGLVRKELEDAVKRTGTGLGMGIKEVELWEEWHEWA